MSDRVAHVMLLYRSMIPSVRLCAHCQMEILAQKKAIEYRAVKITELKTKDIRWADIILIGRLDFPEELRICELLKQDGKYMIYILDDDLLNVPDYLSSSAHYHRTSIQKSIMGMIHLSQALLTPSPILYHKYAEKDAKCLLVEEPAIEPVNYSKRDTGKVIRIGLAGSVDRASDIEMILGEALPRLKKEYGDRISFSFFGAIPAFSKHLNAQTLPYCDSYEQYRKALNDLNWDIGLAPMPTSAFHSCKHYNKYVEYAAAGVAGVYSDVLPYTRMKGKLQGATYAQNTPEAWYCAIRDLIENNKKREQIRKTVCDEAKGILSVEASADGLAQQMSEILLYRAPRSTVCYRIGAKKFEIIVQRLTSAFARYGWRLPLRVAKKAIDYVEKRLGL